MSTLEEIQLKLDKARRQRDKARRQRDKYLRQRNRVIGVMQRKELSENIEELVRSMSSGTSTNVESFSADNRDELETKMGDLEDKAMLSCLKRDKRFSKRHWTKGDNNAVPSNIVALYEFSGEPFCIIKMDLETSSIGITMKASALVGDNMAAFLNDFHSEGYAEHEGTVAEAVH